MPVIAEGTLIHKPQQAVEMIVDKLKTSVLDIGYVGSYDERRLPQYPAVVVSAGPRTKELHATHTFNLELRCLLWVYHAKISESHRNRSLADLNLVSDIETVLEEDMEWLDDNGDARVIHAWVESEVPGVMQPRAAKGDLVVGTRMTWYALSQRRF